MANPRETRRGKLKKEGKGGTKRRGDGGRGLRGRERTAPVPTGLDPDLRQREQGRTTAGPERGAEDPWEMSIMWRLSGP